MLLVFGFQGNVLKHAIFLLPAGALIRGGGIKGTMIGRPPCSLEEEGFTGASADTPLRDVGVEPELLACGGEPVLFSTANAFGKEFSREAKVEKKHNHRFVTSHTLVKQCKIHEVSGICSIFEINS